MHYSESDMYRIGYNDYRYSVDSYRFDDLNYIAGYEDCKTYMTELDHPRIPYADGNVLVTEDITYDGNKIPVYIEKPRELLIASGEDKWPGFNDGDLCVVTLYLTTRHWGGPEEGGWWYNLDHVACSVPTMFSKEIIDLTAKLVLDKAGDGIGGDIYSVLGGCEGWIRIERVSGSAAVTTIPTYE